MKFNRQLKEPEPKITIVLNVKQKDVSLLRTLIQLSTVDKDSPKVMRDFMYQVLTQLPENQEKGDV